MNKQHGLRRTSKVWCKFCQCKREFQSFARKGLDAGGKELKVSSYKCKFCGHPVTARVYDL